MSQWISEQQLSVETILFYLSMQQEHTVPFTFIRCIKVYYTNLHVYIFPYKTIRSSNIFSFYVALVLFVKSLFSYCSSYIVTYIWVTI